MKTHNHSFLFFLLLFMTTFFLWGCKLTSLLPSSKTKADVEVLPDPSAGLDSLQSYQVSFHQDAVGNVDGQAYEFQQQIDMTRISGQTDITRELSGSEEPTSFLRIISDGQKVYRWFDPNQTCQGEMGQLQVGEILEPAAFLIPVTNATKLGSEDVNQIKTTHYKFDQNGLNIANPKPDVVGEVWIAEDGGYVVKMTLTIAPPAKMTGKGKEIGQNWTYEISQVNSIDAIPLPQDCAPVPSEIPAMADAQETFYGSGVLTYVTNSQAADVVGFYFKSLTDSGWKTDQKDPGNDLVLPVSLLFLKADQKLTINIDNSNGGGLDVDVLVRSNSVSVPIQSTLVPDEILPTGAEPTISVNESGLPDDIPLYPGVTAVLNMQNVLMVNSTDSIDEVVNYYLEKMPVHEWELQNNVVSEGTTVLIWQKQERIVTITVMPDNNKTSLVISQNSE